MSQSQLQEIVSSRKVLAVSNADGMSTGAVHVVELEGGVVGVFKVEGKLNADLGYTNVTRVNNEVIASAADDLFAFGLKPAKTVIKEVEIGGQTYRGSFSLFHPGLQKALDVKDMKLSIMTHDKIKMEMNDFLADNIDRTPENFLISPNRKIQTIDESSTFSYRNEAKSQHGMNYGDGPVEQAWNVNSPEQVSEARFVESKKGWAVLSRQPKKVKEFLKTSDGSRIERRIRLLDQQKIKEFLSKQGTGMSAAEIDEYAAHLNLRRQGLLNYIDRVKSLP
jgi:hypothetical protein